MKEVNKYRIIWNPFWCRFQCSFDGVIYAEFIYMQDAIDYCLRG